MVHVECLLGVLRQLANIVDSQSHKAHLCRVPPIGTAQPKKNTRVISSSDKENSVINKKLKSAKGAKKSAQNSRKDQPNLSDKQKPTCEEFFNFFNYIEQIEREDAHKAGIAEVSKAQSFVSYIFLFEILLYSILSTYVGINSFLLY